MPIVHPDLRHQDAVYSKLGQAGRSDAELGDGNHAYAELADGDDGAGGNRVAIVAREADV